MANQPQVNKTNKNLLKAVTTLSFLGFAIFLFFTKKEILSAIEYFLPQTLKAQKGIFFVLLTSFFVVVALIVIFLKRWKVFASFFMRLLLSFTFILASIPKILDPLGFALDISHYDFFPKITINLIAITLPWIELFIGISLIFYFFDKGGILLVNLILVAFLILLGQAWIRGLDIDCGCFGHTGAREGVSKAFIRDLFLVSWSMLLFLFSREKN